MSRNLTAGVALALLLLHGSVSGELTERERRLLGVPPSADIQGEIIELTADGDRFGAIFLARRRPEGRGAVVLLHDQAGSANGLEVVRPLRLALAETGWDTLSLQLPQASRAAGRDGWRARQAQILTRLQSGLDWLGSRQPANRVIVAQGDSGAVALEYALDRPPGELRGLVLVSAFLDPGGQDNPAPDPAQPALPVLDIYAGRDHPDVVENAPARRDSAARDGRMAYRQRVIDGAGAGFFALESELTAQVSHWLAVRASGNTGR